MKNQQISRRSFVKGTAGVAGVAAMGAALTGCGGSGSTSTDSASKKKILRFGQSNAKLGLDMQKSTNSGSSSVADNIVESPLHITEDNKLVPCLLEDVPTPEADGVTYKLKCRKGIKFHDGSEFTSQDIKYSFERMFTPATGAKSTYMYDMIVGAKDMLAGTATECAGIVCDDDYTCTITLEYPMATFVKNLGINYACIFPHEACAAAGDKWGQGTDIVGTGPYKMVSNDDTTLVELEPFADYHGDAEGYATNLDKIEIHYIDDLNTQLMNFKNGDIDYCNLDASLLAQYKADADVSPCIEQYLPLGTEFINLNLNDDALKDVRVRQALSLAINRDELVNTVMSGAGQVAKGFLNPAEPGYDESAPDLAYDPEKAKALLAEAGVSNLSLTCPVRASGQKVMVAVQAYWAAIGVNVDVQLADNGVWQSDWAAGNLQVTELGWYPLFADADNHMYTYFVSSNAKGKSSFYNNSEFDDLMMKGRQSVDEAARAEIYKQADDILVRQDFATLPLFYPKRQFVAKSYVKNAKVGNLIYHLMDIDIDTTDANYTTEA